MKRTLVIGAGDFGLHLICELLDVGCVVDVMDKEAAPQYALRGKDCRYILRNAWNLETAADLSLVEYDCCYVCMGGSIDVQEHVTALLRQGNARRIVVRAKREQDIKHFLLAGADQVICPAQFTSHHLAQEALNLPS